MFNWTWLTYCAVRRQLYWISEAPIKKKKKKGYGAGGSSFFIKKFKYLKHPRISDSGSHEHQDVSELVSSGPTLSGLSQHHGEVVSGLHSTSSVTTARESPLLYIPSKAPELLLGEPTKVTLKVLGFRLRASLRSQLPAFVIYYLCVSVVT